MPEVEELSCGWSTMQRVLPAMVGGGAYHGGCRGRRVSPPRAAGEMGPQGGPAALSWPGLCATSAYRMVRDEAIHS